MLHFHKHCFCKFNSTVKINVHRITMQNWRRNCKLQNLVAPTQRKVNFSSQLKFTRGRSRRQLLDKFQVLDETEFCSFPLLYPLISCNFLPNLSCAMFSDIQFYVSFSNFSIPSTTTGLSVLLIFQIIIDEFYLYLNYQHYSSFSSQPKNSDTFKLTYQNIRTGIFNQIS